MSDELKVDEEVISFRNKANLVSGVLLQSAAFLVVPLLDTLQIYNKETDFNEAWWSMLWTCLGFLALGAVAGRAFAIPVVRCTAEHLQVVNPLRSYVVPWSQIEKVDLTERWPMVMAGQRKIHLVGAGHSMLMRFRGSGHRITTILRREFKAERLRLARGVDAKNESVVVTWTKIRRYEWAYLLFTVAYAIGGTLRATGAWQ